MISKCHTIHLAIVSVHLNNNTHTLKILLNIFILSLLFNSCLTKSNNNQSSGYIIVDTIPRSEELIESFGFSYDEYPMLFLGELNDSVYVSYEYFFLPIPPPPPFTDDMIYFLKQNSDSTSAIPLFDTAEYQKGMIEYKEAIKSHALIEYECTIKDYSIISKTIYSNPVSIIVDTTLTISKYYNSYTELPYPAYPILITNHSEDTIMIDCEREFDAILEAKDSMNNWSMIKCSNKHSLWSEKYYRMPPNYSIITATHISKGDYKTKLRLKFGKNTSNEWSGHINYNQFNTKFDE